jgi:hypothetical protein
MRKARRLTEVERWLNEEARRLTEVAKWLSLARWLGD